MASAFLPESEEQDYTRKRGGVSLGLSKPVCCRGSSVEKFVTFGVDFNNKDLGILSDLMESGKMTPVGRPESIRLARPRRRCGISKKDTPREK